MGSTRVAAAIEQKADRPSSRARVSMGRSSQGAIHRVLPLRGLDDRTAMRRTAFTAGWRTRGHADFFAEMVGATAPARCSSASTGR
jgi:hypothetical protein